MAASAAPASVPTVPKTPEHVTQKTNGGASTITGTFLLPFLTNKTTIRGSIYTGPVSACIESPVAALALNYLTPVFAPFLQRVLGLYSRGKSAAWHLNYFLEEYNASVPEQLTFGTSSPNTGAASYDIDLPETWYVDSNFVKGFGHASSLAIILSETVLSVDNVEIVQASKRAENNTGQPSYYIERLSQIGGLDEERKKGLQRVIRERIGTIPNEELSLFTVAVKDCWCASTLAIALTTVLSLTEPALTDLFVQNPTTKRPIFTLAASKTPTPMKDILLRTLSNRIDALLQENTYQSPFSGLFRAYLALDNSDENTYSTDNITVLFDRMVEKGKRSYRIALELVTALLQFEDQTDALLVRTVWRGVAGRPWVNDINWLPQENLFANDVAINFGPRGAKVADSGLSPDDQIFLLYRFNEETPVFALSFTQAEYLLKEFATFFYYRVMAFTNA